MAKYWAKRFKNVILVGMPTAGKRTFGKVYAYHSERLFLDFESYIESVTKRNISEIYSSEGEEGFRIIEEKILKRLEHRHNYVISMGEGTLLKKENYLFARKIGLIVLLNTPLEILTNRIFLLKDIIPGFSAYTSIDEIRSKVAAMWEARKENYELADVILETYYNTEDALKLQLELVEKRASNRDYMREIYNIMNDKENTINEEQ